MFAVIMKLFVLFEIFLAASLYCSCFLPDGRAITLQISGAEHAAAGLQLLSVMILQKSGIWLS